MRSLAGWFAPLLVAAALLLLGGELLTLHARALDLGGSTPLLGEEAAAYAVSARELSERGWPATSFALPIELIRHPRPPWPVANLEPGLLLADGALLRGVTGETSGGPRPPEAAPSIERRMWLVPVASALALGLLLAFAAAGIVRGAPGASPFALATAFVVGGAFLLDPEALHLALVGASELPFTLGLVAALAWLAGGGASRRPFAFGLLLGVTGAFGSRMLWLVWVLALGAALADPSPASLGRRARAFVLVVAGFAVPLLPWWLFRWRSSGWPAWDITRWTLWDGIQGRTWFAISHMAEVPLLPDRAGIPALLAAKLTRNFPSLLLGLAAGPGALWIGSLAVWLAVSRRSRPLSVAAGVVLTAVAVAVVASALGLARHRDLFSLRVPLEAAGLLATLGLATRVNAAGAASHSARALGAGLLLLALGWGGFEVVRGNRMARLATFEPTLPDVSTLEDVADRLSRSAADGEPVMSNLGASLAWRARRPVIHLALTPGDVEACRQKVPFRLLVVAFRDPAHAWSGWADVIARPREAAAQRDWNFLHTRTWETTDGFRVVWIEMGPPREQLAGGAPGEP